MSSDRERSVLVVASYAPSLLNFRGELLRSLVDRGWQVTGCAPGSDEDLVSGLARLGVGYESIPLERSRSDPFSDLRLIRHLVGLFRRRDPELVFAYTMKPVLYASIAARIGGVPRMISMVTGLGSLFAGGRPRDAARREVLRHVFRAVLSRNEAVVFQNPDDLDYFVARGMVDADRAHRVHGSGVDLDHFAASPVPAGPPAFLMIARLLVEKGVREYAQAAMELRQRGHDVRCDLVGPLEDHPHSIDTGELDRWIQSGAIHWHGATDDVRPFLQQCSVYVLPSYREGTPRSVLEAMSTGRAIVTTDAPGCRETVVEGENGFLVPVADPVVLADAMERFLQEPGLVAPMGRASRALAVERFDVHRVNEELMAILDPHAFPADPH